MQKSFGELWDENSPKIMSHCKKVARDYGIDWEDLYSEAFLRSGRNYNGIRHFTTYVGQAILWVAQETRRKSYWGKNFGGNPPTVESRPEAGLNAHAKAPSENHICDRLAAEELMSELPPKITSMLRGVFSGDTLAEIGQKHGLTASGVKVALHRMRKRVARG